MDIEITRDQRNELLSRREVDFRINYEGATPSRNQIMGKLSALLSVNEKHMVVDTLNNRFRTTSLSGSARVYMSDDAREKTERSYLITRGTPKGKEEGA